MSTFEVRDPRTAQVITHVAETPLEEVARLGQAARDAFPTWRGLSLKQRVGYLKQVREAFYAQRLELAELEGKETGKPPVETLSAGILNMLELITWFCKAAPKVLADESVFVNPVNFPRKRGYIVHEPLGTVAVVSSWNYPIALAMRAIVPALLAGNCVMFKPPKEAALTGACLGKILEGVLPKGVFATVQGGREVISAVVRESQRLQFIGSTATGKALAHQCAEQGISAAFELSGVDAAIILPDCDLERTVHGVVWGAFTNTGQNCASIERVLVHKDIAARFIPRLVEETRKLRLGEDVGPLRSARQLRQVEAHVADAVSRGAEVLCGGKATGAGYYFEPTVLKVPRHEGLAIEEETFGPTLPVVVVDSVEEAVRLANGVNFGLTAGVWTQDLAAGEKLCQQLEVGVAMVNNASFTATIIGAPWGGVKGTGHGVTNSKYILLELTRPKFVLVDGSRSKELWWYPYNSRLEAILSALTDANAGHLSRMGAALAHMIKRWE